jgi:hypothetical protein
VQVDIPSVSFPCNFQTLPLEVLFGLGKEPNQRQLCEYALGINMGAI